VSAVQVSASFQTTPCLVGRLGSEVWSRQFSKFCFKNVCLSRHVFAIPSAFPVPER